MGQWRDGRAPCRRRREAAEELPAAPRAARRRAGRRRRLEERLPAGGQARPARGTGAGRDPPRRQGAGRRHDARFADRGDGPGLAGADGDPRRRWKSVSAAASPRKSCADLETARQRDRRRWRSTWARSRGRGRRPPAAKSPPESYRIDQFPEYLKLRKQLDLLASPGLGNPFFSVHQGMTDDRTMIGGRELVNFRQLQLPGDVGRPGGDRRPPRRPSTATARASRPAGWSRARRRCTASWSGRSPASSAPRRRSSSSAAMPPTKRCIGHLLGPGDLILHDALAHNSIIAGRAPVRRAAAAVRPQRLRRPPTSCSSSSGTNTAAC